MVIVIFRYCSVCTAMRWLISTDTEKPKCGTRRHWKSDPTMFRRIWVTGNGSQKTWVEGCHNYNSSAPVIYYIVQYHYYQWYYVSTFLSGWYRWCVGFALNFKHFLNNRMISYNNIIALYYYYKSRINAHQFDNIIVS